MYGRKIKTIRELRGFSQAYLAEKLGMAQNTYSRIETNQTRLNAETLEKIATELGVSPLDIISSEPTVVNFSPNQGLNHIENFYSIQKEIVDRMFQSKEEEINNLKSLYQEIILSRDNEIQRLQKIIDDILSRKR